MFPLANIRRSALRRGLVVATGAALLLTTALTDVASAHGSTIDPASRNYGCWKRWGSDFQNPQMATLDPMCWQAWQADTNAMWNWNGLYREGVAGNHQAAIPDGQLCSGGLTGDGRYAAMDTPGAWQATNVNNSFTVVAHDQARHGANYYRVYVTKQGYDPLTQRLAWGNLELLKDTGPVAPGAGSTTTDPVLGGVSVAIPVSAPGRTGRHLVFTIWQAAHADQSYYWCADVNFPGGSGGGTASPSPSASPSRSSTSPSTPASPPVSASVTTPPAGTRTCSASYAVTGQWAGGFQADVKITAGTSAISGWTVRWNFGNGQQISSAWGATVTSSGTAVTAANAAYNGSVGASASTSFGFIGTWTGSNAVPTLTCTAT